MHKHRHDGNGIGDDESWKKKSSDHRAHPEVRQNNVTLRDR
jgi:hypothetical protein